MVNTKALWLSILLSAGATENALPIPEQNKNNLEISDPSKMDKTIINIVDVLWDEKINLFKHFKDPKDLIAFYRLNISDNKSQPKEYRKMWRSFDKMLMDVVNFNDKYEKNEDKFFYIVDCPLDEKDIAEWISSVSLNVSVEKFSKDEDVYLPKLILTKVYKSGIVVYFILKPELSITRDRRAYVWNEKRDKYQVLLIEFVLEWYSEKNEDRKKTISIQSSSKMSQEIKEFQKRIKMLSKDKKHKEREEKDRMKKEYKEKILAEKTREQEKKILSEKKLQKEENDRTEKKQQEEMYRIKKEQNLAEETKNNKTENAVLDTLQSPLIVDSHADTNIVVSDKTVSENYEKEKSNWRNSIKDRKVLQIMFEISKNNRETLRALLRSNSEILRTGREKNRVAIKAILNENNNLENEKNQNIKSDEDLEKLKNLEEF